MWRNFILVLCLLFSFPAFSEEATETHEGVLDCSGSPSESNGPVFIVHDFRAVSPSKVAIRNRTLPSMSVKLSFAEVGREGGNAPGTYAFRKLPQGFAPRFLHVVGEGYFAVIAECSGITGPDKRFGFSVTYEPFKD